MKTPTSVPRKPSDRQTGVAPDAIAVTQSDSDASSKSKRDIVTFPRQPQFTEAVGGFLTAVHPLRDDRANLLVARWRPLL